jgi:pilus assembly protein Flp/PilA
MLNKLAVKWAMFKQDQRDALAKFKQDENGASAIEYAVMAAILVGVIVIALAFLDFDTAFDGINDNLNPAAE